LSNISAFQIPTIKPKNPTAKAIQEAALKELDVCVIIFE
jgi:hypothetical protein